MRQNIFSIDLPFLYFLVEVLAFAVMIIPLTLFEVQNTNLVYKYDTVSKKPSNNIRLEISILPYQSGISRNRRRIYLSSVVLSVDTEDNYDQ